MSEDTTTHLNDAAADLRKAEMLKAVCPFCGQINQKGDLACPRCGMEDTPGTRQATRSKVGPWSVLQHRNPSAPGMNFETLVSLIDKGRVTPRSIMRGPTTHQLWRYASKVKGVSREFGLCWGCGGQIIKTAKVCPECKRLQDPPLNPDALVERTGADVNPAPAAMSWPTSSRQVVDLSTAVSAKGSEKVEMIEMADHRGSLEFAAFGMNNNGRQRRRRPVLAASIIAVALLILAACGLYLFDQKSFFKVQRWVKSEWHELVRPSGEQGGRLTSDQHQDPVALDDARHDPIETVPAVDHADPNLVAKPTLLNNQSTPATRPSIAELPSTQPTTQRASIVPTTRPTVAVDAANSSSQVDIGPPILNQGPVETQTPTPKIRAAEKLDTPVYKADEIQITPTAPMSNDEATARAALLRLQAFEASNRKDYAAAVKCWEDMLKLPEKARHSDLQQNLKEAREHLNAN